MTETPNPSLVKLLASAQLPALPQSAIRLLELSQDPENGPAEFALPIEADPGLTGQVLRFVNSSYFGFSREISSVKLAITLVGIRTIKNFALWSAVFSLMPNPKCGPFDLKKLWQDSLRRGLFARQFGKEIGVKDVEELFAAALLQDMAVPLLAKELPNEYCELLAGREGGRTRLSDLELQRFGWTHAEAAGIIARSWRLPDGFARLVEHHPEIDDLLSEEQPQLDRLAVSLSALLPSATDPNWNERDAFLTHFQKLAPSTLQVTEMLGVVDSGFEEFAPVLKIGTPPRTLVECLEGEARVNA